MRYGIILKCFRMGAANFGLGIAKKLVLIKITIYTGGPRGPAMRVKGGLCGRKRLSAWDGYWDHQYKGGFHHGWGGERVASAFRGDRLICPGPGMAEQDALQWWDSAVEIFRELGMKAGRMDWRESGQLRSARRRLRCCPLTPRASLCAMRSSGWTGVAAAS